MQTSRYATTRQKACQHCSAAKARCDRKSGSCGRCGLRGLSCTYPQTSLSGTPTTENSLSISVLDSSPSTSCSTPSINRTSRRLFQSEEREPQLPPWPRENNSQLDASSASFTEVNPHKEARVSLGVSDSAPPSSGELDFSGLELATPITPEDIRNRWLNAYVPIPGQKTKEYPANVTTFIYRVLKSYTATTMYGRGVHPFIHSSQLASSRVTFPLSTCLNLVRICEKPLPGSETVVADMVQKEMVNLYDQRGTYDGFALLGVFQAYLIYSMVLFFRFGETSNPLLRQAVVNLQELACSTSQQGVMCAAEQRHTRPGWEAWIVAEAKRRTLFVMYLFDSLLSTHEGLPTFLGAELSGLPAPSNKTLWRAQTRSEWEIAYNVHLGSWPQGSLHIDELWPIPENLGNAEPIERHNRVDRWLVDVDEFGTMLYAVTCCTHGS